MPHFHPPVPPHLLSERMRDAEREVWGALQRLDYSWHVFYSARSNSESGWDREIDFVLIRLNCIFYCEVKGGTVIVDQRAGAGVSWTHMTRSGELLRKRVDSAQLWRAKAELGETVRRIAGATPRNLGFREHDVYIFPHTPRNVTQGIDLERGNVHYVFAGDIADLSVRLQQIVDDGKGVFIDRDRIEGILNAFDALVIKTAAAGLPRQETTAPILSPAAAYIDQEGGFTVLSRAVTQPSGSLRRFREYAARPLFVVGVLLGAFGLLDAIQDFSSVPEASKRTAHSAAPRSSKPAPTSSTTPLGSELPGFVAPVSVNEVEQAIARAKRRDVYVSWQSETQKGLVILLANEENGCRRYQVSRHDVHPVVYGIVRRCF